MVKSDRGRNNQDDSQTPGIIQGTNLTATDFSDTDSPRALFGRALALHQQGACSDALPLYERVLAREPEQVDVRYLLGTAQLQLGRFRECIATLEEVVRRQPDMADAHNNLGVAYKALGEWEPAAKAFQAAIRANPDYDQALYNLGRLMEERALPADAEKCYRHALDMRTEDCELRARLAQVLAAQKKWCEAEDAYRLLSETERDNLDWQAALAYTLAMQERLDEASVVYENILKVRPDFCEVENSLSYVLERKGRLAESLQRADRAVALNPGYAEAHNNRGHALRSLHRLDEACNAFAQALRINPNLALAEFNLATTQLLAGDYRAGWAGYERHAELNPVAPRRFDAPAWDGSRIDGKRLFVYADQGYGDTIQLARFLSRARAQSGARVIFECPVPLARLLGSLAGVDQLVVEGAPLPGFDYQLPLASLPGRLNVDIDSVSTGDSYLAAPAELPAELEALLREGNAAALTVGLVWQGNPQQARDNVRSCPLRMLMPLFSVRGIRWVSLQVEEKGLLDLVKIAPARRPIEIGSRLKDFAETAAVIDRLDLLVTVDTAAAHLAGALGKPVWTMLCHTPDWRWHLATSDSPWYPTMRLFRQPAWGDWPSVVATVAEELERLVSTRQ